MSWLLILIRADVMSYMGAMAFLKWLCPWATMAREVCHLWRLHPGSKVLVSQNLDPPTSFRSSVPATSVLQQGSNLHNASSARHGFRKISWCNSFIHSSLQTSGRGPLPPIALILFCFAFVSADHLTASSRGILFTIMSPAPTHSTRPTKQTGRASERIKGMISSAVRSSGAS